MEDNINSYTLQIEDRYVGVVEDLLIEQGARYIIGVDEVGMGPLAGPVTAAAVMIDCDNLDAEWLSRVNDSKKLSESKRDSIVEDIRANVVDRSVASRSPAAIDAKGLSKCLEEVMTQVVCEIMSSSGIHPDVVVIDGTGSNLPVDVHQIRIKKGDGLSYHIGAASILAKVSRDSHMYDMHARWPEYGFCSHKGYGTKQHIEAIERHGPCSVHRLTFGKVRQHKERLRTSPRPPNTKV